MGLLYFAGVLYFFPIIAFHWRNVYKNDNLKKGLQGFFVFFTFVATIVWPIFTPVLLVYKIIVGDYDFINEWFQS